MKTFLDKRILELSSRNIRLRDCKRLTSSPSQPPAFPGDSLVMRTPRLSLSEKESKSFALTTGFERGRTFSYMPAVYTEPENSCVVFYRRMLRVVISSHASPF